MLDTETAARRRPAGDAGVAQRASLRDIHFADVNTGSTAVLSDAKKLKRHERREPCTKLVPRTTRAVPPSVKPARGVTENVLAGV